MPATRAIFVCAIAALSLGLVLHTFLSPSGWTRRQKARADLTAIRAENARIESQANALRAEIKALRTRPEVQEHAVRDELGFVRPDDLVLEVRTGPTVAPAGP